MMLKKSPSVDNFQHRIAFRMEAAAVAFTDGFRISRTAPTSGELGRRDRLIK